MLGIFKKINRILGESLIWNPLQGKIRMFSTDKYPQEECWIQINNFPEEPLWTLYYRGESIDIEDTPALWRINYPQDEV
ncbi:MAG: hypothetical protein ACK4LB_11410 [Spirosomataceae bacterium]